MKVVEILEYLYLLAVNHEICWNVQGHVWFSCFDQML